MRWRIIKILHRQRHFLDGIINYAEASDETSPSIKGTNNINVKFLSASREMSENVFSKLNKMHFFILFSGFSEPWFFYANWNKSFFFRSKLPFETTVFQKVILIIFISPLLHSTRPIIFFCMTLLQRTLKQWMKRSTANRGSKVK